MASSHILDILDLVHFRGSANEVRRTRGRSLLFPLQPRRSIGELSAHHKGRGRYPREWITCGACKCSGPAKRGLRLRLRSKSVDRNCFFVVTLDLNKKANHQRRAWRVELCTVRASAHLNERS